MTEPVIDVADLVVEYRRGARTTRALDGVSFSVAPGERLAIVGESGSGKTTAALTLLGLLPPQARVVAGRARVGEADLATAPERVARRIRGRTVGLVPQDPTVSLNPTQRVGQQVAEAVRLRGVRGPLVDVAVLDALSQAGIDDPAVRARQYPHELSGGLRQRVLIAIALAGDPEILVADEPTSALDVTVQKRILDHLDRLVRERGIALVIITHDLGVAADRADRIVVMSQGEVVETGPARDVLTAPRHPYTRRLLAAAPAWRSAPPRAARAPARPVVEWIGATKDFALPRGGSAPSIRAVDDVTLTAHAGRTLAVVGESGSGKTTLLRLALGVETPSRGEVRFDGTSLTGLGWREARPLRRRFQLVQQNPFSSLDPRFTVGRSIAEPLVAFGIGDGRTRRARVAELVDLVGLPSDAARRRPAELSGGQRQRVAIARALAIEPEVIYLDEPVSALDVSVQDQILRLLTRLQDDLGVSYVFVSHDLSVVAEIAHEVAVVHRGRVVEHGPAAEVLQRPQHPHTAALLEAVTGRALGEAA